MIMILEGNSDKSGDHKCAFLAGCYPISLILPNIGTSSMPHITTSPTVCCSIDDSGGHSTLIDSNDYKVW